jgi:hypothetical protein
MWLTLMSDQFAIMFSVILTPPQSRHESANVALLPLGYEIVASTADTEAAGR